MHDIRDWSVGARRPHDLTDAASLARAHSPHGGLVSECLRLQRLVGNRAVSDAILQMRRHEVTVQMHRFVPLQRCDEKDRVNLPPNTPLKPVDEFQESKTHRDLRNLREFKEVCRPRKSGQGEECRKRWVQTHEVVCTYEDPTGERFRGRTFNSYVEGLDSPDTYAVCPGVTGFKRAIMGSIPSIPGSGATVKLPVWSENITASDFNGGIFKEKKEPK